MTRIARCIAYEHNVWLVVVAALVCIAGSWAVIRLFYRASVTAGLQRAGWHVLTAVAAAAAIWCTHFIAILAYDPGVPVAFDPVLTMVSLLIAMAGAAVGFAAASSGLTRLAPTAGGVIVGLAIVAMHYTGMMAYRVQGVVSWDGAHLIASLILAPAFSAAALHFALRRVSRADKYVATGALVLAIVAMHFTGMTAFKVEPMPIEGTYTAPGDLRALAFAVAGVAMIIVGAGLASYLIDDQSRVEASLALGNMSNGLLMVASDGTVRLYNRRLVELFGLKPEDLWVGMSLDRYLQHVGGLCGWDEARTKRVIDNHGIWMARDTITRVEHNYDDGRVFSISCRPMTSGGAIITYDDVTEAREGQKKIAHMAFHDALTGLPNRRSFAEQMARLRQTSPTTMLMLDLDRFKDVNDTLGHAIGDKLLIQVAQRLREVCGPANLVFRLGGDELAVLADPDEVQAHRLATRIVEALSHPFQIDEHAVAIGCSVGVATARHGSDPWLIQQMADLALYKAKENGRNRVEAYQDGMIEELAQRRRLEADLAAAMATGQLALHYQPLFDLPGCVLSGFEALLRWNHPDRGLISPADFVPVAEQNGSIIDIGAWVIDEACRQAALWPPHIYVSINVSPVQLRSADILRQFTSAIDRHRLTPRRVEVEVTETAMVENSAQIAAALTGLRSLGVRIAMDDFGTGYSSLAHLRQFELDRIKIDRSFISASRNDVGSAAVVRAITGMAKDMAIATTGEGVENADQLSRLIELGCGTVQGYLLGKPLDAGRATELACGGAPSARAAAPLRP